LERFDGDPKWEKQIDELMAAVDKYVRCRRATLKKPFLMR